jgi:hypothetical protein
MQRKKSIFVYASAISIVGVLVPLSATPGLAREAKNTIQNSSYQLQSASSSYAYEPRTVVMSGRRGQCWIATDAARPYGFIGACANPLARDPSLNPVYDGELHGE